MVCFIKRRVCIREVLSELLVPKNTESRARSTTPLSSQHLKFLALICVNMTSG